MSSPFRLNALTLFLIFIVTLVTGLMFIKLDNLIVASYLILASFILFILSWYLSLNNYLRSLSKSMNLEQARQVKTGNVMLLVGFGILIIVVIIFGVLHFTLMHLQEFGTSERHLKALEIFTCKSFLYTGWAMVIGVVILSFGQRMIEKRCKIKCNEISKGIEDKDNSI